MTENLERYVLEALQKAVIAAVGTTLPVKFVGRNMQSVVSGKWWEVVFIPNNIENEFWADGKTYQGIMRLILHWPQDDKGAYPAMDEVKRVSDQFQKGNRYADPANKVAVQIQEHPNVMGVMEEAPQLLIPLTVRYSFFKI